MLRCPLSGALGLGLTLRSIRSPDVFLLYLKRPIALAVMRESLAALEQAQLSDYPWRGCA